MVGTDQHMWALSVHIQKPYWRKSCLVLIAVILLEIIIFEPNSFVHMSRCVNIVKAKNQIAPSKAVVGVDQPI